MATSTVPIDLARSLLDYDPDTGVLRWRKNRTVGTKAGDIAGSPTGDGYQKIRLLGKPYRAHRVAFAMYYNRQPAEQLDHIDGDRGNNKIANLREATNSQNAMNMKIASAHSVGVKNVSIDKKKYVVRLQANGNLFRIGRFDTLNEASEAAKKAREFIHGEFARHG